MFEGQPAREPCPLVRSAYLTYVAEVVNPFPHHWILDEDGETLIGTGS